MAWIQHLSLTSSPGTRRTIRKNGWPVVRFAASGFERWLRNIAVGLGNAPSAPAIIAALSSRQDDPSPMLREHVAWALARHRASTG
jgi:epoxyqueuosine reductase QueG